MPGSLKRRLTSVREIGRKELQLLAASMVFVLCLWAFFFIAGAVTEGSTQYYDERVLTSVRSVDGAGTSQGPAWLDQVMVDISALGGATVIVLSILAVTGYLLLLKRYRMLAFVILAVVGGALLEASLKELYGRERPSVVHHLAYATSASFPSGHSMMSAVVYLTLAALLARIQRRWHVRLYLISIALLISLLIGFSRIYLGVHYPTDVLGGWSLGLAWAIFCWFAASYVERRTLWGRRERAKLPAARDG